MKMEYFPVEMMIADLYTKYLQGKSFRLFWNLILNLGEEYIINIKNLETLTKIEKKTESADCAKSSKSLQECVVKNDKVGSLNMGSCDVVSDDVQHTVDTHDVIERTKTGLLGRLKSVAAEAA